MEISQPKLSGQAKTMNSNVEDRVANMNQELEQSPVSWQEEKVELLKVQENHVKELEEMKREKEQLINLLFPHLLPLGKPVHLLDGKSKLRSTRFKSNSRGARFFSFPELGAQAVPVDGEVDELEGKLQTSYSVPVQWEVDGLAVLQSRVRELEQEVNELKQENYALGEERKKLRAVLGLNQGKQRQPSLESRVRELQQHFLKAQEQRDQLNEELSSKTEIIKQLKAQLKLKCLEEDRNKEMKKTTGDELDVVINRRTGLQDKDSRTTETMVRLSQALCGVETGTMKGDMESVDVLESKVMELVRKVARLEEQLQIKQRTVKELKTMLSAVEEDWRHIKDLYELEKGKSISLEEQCQALGARGKLEQEESRKLNQGKDKLIEHYKTKLDNYDQQVTSLDKLRELNQNELRRLYMTLKSEREQGDEKATWELLKQAVNELKEGKQSFEAKLASKTAQFEELKRERCKLESCLQEEKYKVEKLEVEMLKVEHELESAWNSQDSLRAELATKTAKVEELEQERCRLESCLGQEKHKIEKLLKVDEEINQEIFKLKGSLKQEKKKVADLKLKMLKVEDELEAARKSLKTELAIKTAEVEELEQKRCRLESCLEHEKNKMRDLQKGQLDEVNRSKETVNKVKELENRTSILEQDKQVLVNQVEAARNENKLLLVVLKFLRAGLFTNAQRARSLSNKVDKTRALLEKKEDEVRRLLEELNKAEQAMAEEKSSLLAEVDLRIEEKREAIRQLSFSISCMRDVNEELKAKLKNLAKLKHR